MHSYTFWWRNSYKLFNCYCYIYQNLSIFLREYVADIPLLRLGKGGVTITMIIHPTTRHHNNFSLRWNVRGWSTSWLVILGGSINYQICRLHISLCEEDKLVRMECRRSGSFLVEYVYDQRVIRDVRADDFWE